MTRRVWLHAAILALTAAVRLSTVARADVADIIATIEERAIAHGVSPAWLVAVARCESTFNPFAVNGRFLGLYQLGSPGEGDRFWARGYTDIWSAWQQADFAAARFSEGGSGAWSCS